MATGKIKRWFPDRGFGYITPDDGSQDVRFYGDNLRGGTANQIREGARVDYTLRSGGRQPTTATFSLLGQEQSRPGTASPARTSQDRGSRFYNPYNFVRLLDPGQATEGNMAAALMGRCPPPPHDRWVGLTGRIVCQLTAATPLFVADAGYAYQNDNDRKNDHRTYQFFKYDFGSGEEPALPASSLRGMVRAAFEVATNSCFAHFDYDARLSYHLEASEALKLVPARVENLAGEDEPANWVLRLLPGKARVKVGQRPDELYAGRVERYEALRKRPPKNRKPGPPPKPFAQRQVALGNLKHGDHCYALARRLNFPPVWQVEMVANDQAALQTGSRQDPGLEILEGYLCLNNQNIENKRFERFFFQDTRRPVTVSLNDTVRARYRELIADYQARHAAAVQSWRKADHPPHKPRERSDSRGRKIMEAGFSRFIIGGPQGVQDGDLVYAMLSGTGSNLAVEYIVPVAIPRVGFNRKVHDLLPRHLHKCHDVDNLCPACRTFGWTYGRPGDTVDRPPDEALTAYAGRLRFSHGKLAEPARPMAAIALSILGSPKPTTTRFYLQSKRAGKPLPGQNDASAGYDNNDNVLRGRKVYRHHGHAGEAHLNYWKAERGEHRQVGKNSDQNRTIHDPLPPETRFTFTVDFENLAPAELGALLWSLTLEEGLYHRLGLGKPLGLGSVQVAVDSLRLLQPASRYSQALTDGWSENLVNTAEYESYGRVFRQGMQDAHRTRFDDLVNIQDLRVLLREPAQGLPVHYPRPGRERDPDGKNYEWFMGNNRKPNLRKVLPLPTEDDGLTFIDKFGNEG